MELVLETGSGLPNANAYQSVANVKALLAGSPNLAAFDNLQEPEPCVVLATQILDVKWRHYGDTLTTTQALQWPRTINYDSRGKQIPAGTIPTELLLAHATLCGMLAADPDLSVDLFEGQLALKSFSTDGLALSFGDPISKQTMEGADLEQILGPRFPMLEMILRPIAERKGPAWLSTAKSIIRR